MRCLLLFVCMFALFAAAAPAATDATIRVELGSDPHTLLPILRTTSDEAAVDGLIFDPLVAYDSRRQVHPVLAAIVPTLRNGGISADGLTITVHLRHGVKWQDGAPFTAADVVYTMHAILDPKNLVANRSDYTKIARVDAVGTDVVVFHLKEPLAAFLTSVASGYQILPAHLLANSTNLATDPFNAQPVGTGPYRFVRWQRGSQLEVAANPGYFLGPPKNPGVLVSIIQDSNTLAIQIRQHAIDFAMVESSTYNVLTDAPGVVRTTEPLSDFNALALNEAHPIMQDPRIRRAIVLAIDRARLTRTVSFGTGTPAFGDLPLFMYDGHPPAGWDTFDPVAAGKLFDAAGWTMGPNNIRMKDGQPLHLQLIGYNGSASTASLTLQVQQMLSAVGIDVEYKSYTPTTYFLPASAGGPMSGGNFDIGLVSFVNGDDPGNTEIYGCASRAPAGFNFAGYCNPEMERLQAAQQREYDPARRNALIAQIEALAARDSVYVFLYHTPYRIAYNPALHREPASISNRWYDIRNWTR